MHIYVPDICGYVGMYTPTRINLCFVLMLNACVSAHMHTEELSKLWCKLHQK